MKKILIVVVILIIGASGYLAYDWQLKTSIQGLDRGVYPIDISPCLLYDWTTA